MRLRVLLLLLALLLLAAPFAAGWVALASIDWNARREMLTERLSAALGRPVRIEGGLALDLDWSLEPEVEIRDLVVGAPAHAEPEERARFGRVELQFAVSDLLRRRLHFDSLQVFDGEIVLYASEEAPPESPEETTGPPRDAKQPERDLDLDVRWASLRNVRIVQRDAARGITATTTLERVVLRTDTAGDDFALEARGDVNGVAFDLEGRLDPVRQLFRSRGPYAFELEGALGGARVDVRGTLDRPADLRGADIRLQARASDLAPLGEPFGWDLPALGPVGLSARVTDRDDSLGIEEIDLSLGREEHLHLRLRGDFDDLVELDELELEARLRARDLAAVGEPVGVELPALGPVAVEARLSGSDEHALLRSLAGRLGDTRFGGRLRASHMGGARPRFEAELRSAELRLQDLGLGTGPERLRERTPEDGWLEIPLSFERLRGFDARLALRVGRVVGPGGSAVRDLRATVVLADGILVIEPLRGVYETGSVEGALRVDARATPPRFASRGRIEGADLTRLAALGEDELFTAGRLGAAWELESRGASPKALARALDGSARLRIDGGTLASRWAHRMNPDLWRSLLSPSWRSELTAVRCLVADFEVDAGVATARSLFLDTEHVTLRATGSLDLGSRTLELALVPRAKKPSFLSLVVPVRVEGPISGPRVAAQKTATATQTARGVLRGVLKQGTRPVGKLAPLLPEPVRLPSSEAEDPCETARLSEEGPASRR